MLSGPVEKPFFLKVLGSKRAELSWAREYHVRRLNPFNASVFPEKSQRSTRTRGGIGECNFWEFPFTEHLKFWIVDIFIRKPLESHASGSNPRLFETLSRQDHSSLLDALVFWVAGLLLVDVPCLPLQATSPTNAAKALAYLGSA